MPHSLGTFIRERRQDLGLTQEQLADRIGGSIRQAEVSRLEGGRIALPRRSRLEAIAAALEVSLGELLLRTGWMQDGDQLASAIAASPRNGWTPDAVEALSSEHMPALLEAVAAAETMVTEATKTLERAQATLTELKRTLNVIQNTRGEIRPTVGVITSWELSALFFEA
jgi:transcriptional regulator with XRE-family HTH domain